MMTRLNQILFARNPDATEKATLLGFLASHHEKVVKEKAADGKLAIAIPVGSTVPMGRLGLSEELANAIVFIASDEASFITGHVLNVDGGKTVN